VLLGSFLFFSSPAERRIFTISSEVKSRIEIRSLFNFFLPKSELTKKLSFIERRAEIKKAKGPNLPSI